MKRGYTVDLYRRRLAILREAVPDIEFGSDWIVGFPGETEDDYLATERFLEELGSVVNYVFKYDGRPGTRADDLPDDVSVALKKERNNRLLAVAERVALSRMQNQLERELRVLVEEERKPGRLSGRTSHGLPCSFDGDAALVGTSVRVAAQSASAYGLSGVLA